MPRTSAGKTAVYAQNAIEGRSTINWNEIRNLSTIDNIGKIVNLAANRANYTADNIRLQDGETLEMHNFMHHTVAAGSPQNTTSFIRTGAIDFTSNEDVNKQRQYREGLSIINSNLFASYGKQLENERHAVYPRTHRLYKYGSPLNGDPVTEALSFSHKWNDSAETNGMSSFYFYPYNIEKIRHKAFNKLNGNQRDWLGGELDKVFSLNANLEYDNPAGNFYLNSVYPIKKY